MFKFILSLFILFLPLTVKAEPLTITIYGFRTASDQQSKTYSYDVIEPKDLSSVSSVNVVTNGTNKQLSSTFTRGTNSNHTLLTFNGIPIKDHSTPTGTDDIGQHNLSGFDSIEIIKGPMGTVYGPNSIGGVINMISLPNDQNSIEHIIGSNNKHKTNIKIGETIDNKHIIDVRLSAESSDNISVQDGDEKDPYKTKDYIIQTESYFSGKTLKTAIMQTDNFTHLDGSSDIANYTSDWNFNNQYISWQNKNSEYTFNNSDHKRVYNKSGTTDVYNSNNKTFLARHTFTKDNNDLTLGTEQEISTIDFTTAINGYVSSVDKERTNHGYFMNYDGLFDNGILLHTGFRYDTPSTFDNILTYRIGTHFDGIRLSYSTGFKSPTVYEMYGQDNYGFLGNSNLVPEESKTYEVGYKLFGFDFALYKTEINNLLKYSSNTYINDSKTSHIKGLEIDYKNNWFANKFSYNIAEDGDSIALLRRPKVINSSKFFYNEYSLNVNYYGEHKDIDASTYARKDMSAITTVDLMYNKNINDFDIFFNLNNIFDEQYQKPDGYNQLGRNFNFGIKKTF